MTTKALLESIVVTGDAFVKDPTDETRKQLSDALAKLTAQVTPLNDQLLFLAWAEPARRAALSVALDLGLFEHVVEPITVEDLSKRLSSSAEPLMLNRLLQHLTATFIISSPSPRVYAPTPLSLLLRDPTHAAALRLSTLLHGPNLDALPKFLSTNGYGNPSNPSNLPFHLAHDTRLSPWEWGRQRPEVARAFALHMAGYHAGRPNWLDSYPFKERVIEGSNNDYVLFLDIGGGTGNDVVNVIARYGDSLEGKKVLLQETETMAARAKQMRPDLDVVVGDFFQEQAIKGARAYFLHSVLHDWPNKQCQKVLDQLKAAMKPGYSKLLIYENIVPETNASWKMTALDLIMMANAGGIERTESMWRELVEGAGLKVNEIWTADSEYESVIEVIRTD